MSSSDPATHAEPASALHAPAPLLADDDALASLVASLEADARPAVALDTEADSFHHYFEKVCLIQLALPGSAVLVDPLAPVDLGPLLAHLAPRELLLHGADYDLRLLHRGYGFRASRIFDTMLAAQLLGEREIGLAALLSARLGVTLDKTNQRADWSRRPLAPAMVAYAASDVLHLHALVASLRADLEAKRRLAWHAEECARLAATDFPPRERDPENEWRAKGTNALSAKERAYFRELWAVRERRAEQLDVPPFRVYPTDALQRSARQAAAGTAEPSALFPFSRPLPAALVTELVAAVERARHVPPSAWPGRRTGEKAVPDPALESAVGKLKEKRDRLARQLALDPGLVASRATLADAARAQLTAGRRLDADALAAATGMSRWRAELLAG